MAGVEVLAGLGLMATEVFRYNRENFEFDQDQRFEREELRLKMQVERFALFREDIRDLVELTVGKMKLYHLVGALFLKGVILYYAKGKFEGSPPTFLLALYYVSNACAAVYLLLSIWMAMHASIACTSYGVRLLTRFVRLPIPGSKQLNVLNARMADFERQGPSVMRIPFVQRRANDWQQRGLGGEQLIHDYAEDTLAAAQGLPIEDQHREGGGPSGNGDLDEGQQAFTNAGELLKAVELSTFRHVQLFRQLQAQWQCYDAYARVCMALGVRQMLQSVNYFAIGFMMVDNCEPMASLVITITLQAIAVVLSVLDIHGLPCYGNFDLQVVGSLPAYLTCIALILAKRTGGDCTMVGEKHCEGDVCGKQCVLDSENNNYVLSLASLGLEVCWFELLLWVASPSKDEASLPRHFRTVLFMDVFGDVDDPTEIDYHTGERKLAGTDLENAQDCADSADIARHAAHSALTRWTAARDADAELTEQQIESLIKVRKELGRWTGELRRIVKRHRLIKRQATGDEENPYLLAVVGPFHRRGGGSCFYKAETRKFVHEVPAGHKLLTLGELEEDIKVLKKQILQLQALYGMRYDKRQGRRQNDDSDSSAEELHKNGADAWLSSSSQNRGTSPRSVQRSAAGSRQAESQAGAGGGTTEVKVHPVRLPWKIMRTLTRAIQMVWLVVGIATGMSEFGLADFDLAVDYRGKSVGGLDSGRRLLTAGEPRQDAGQPRALRFDPVDVAWPHEIFFSLETVYCMPAPADDVGVMVGSPFALYNLSRSPVDGELHLQELHMSDFSAAAATFCPLDVASVNRCLLGSLSFGRVTLWSPTTSGLRPGAPQLQVSMAPWKLMAGAIVPCGSTPWLPTVESAGSAAHCLALVGWGGGGTLQVASVPLPDSPLGQAALPGVSSEILPLLELPLHSDAPRSTGLAEAQQHHRQDRKVPTVLALHLSARDMRLWVSMGSGELVAWDLRGRSPQRLARWAPDLPADLVAGAFRTVGTCQDASGALYLAGSASRELSRPVLLRATGLLLGDAA